MSFKSALKMLALSMMVMIVAGCGGDAEKQRVANAELVLEPGGRIEASESKSSVSVFAINQLERSIGWNGCTGNITLSPRRERWFGSFGGTGESTLSISSGIWSKDCTPANRVLIEEEQIHFSSVAVATAWLNRYAKGGVTAWTSDGTVIQWRLLGNRNQLNVSIWQICINGQRASPLTKTVVSVSIKNPSLELSRRSCFVVDSKVQEETEKSWMELWKSAADYESRWR